MVRKYLSCPWCKCRTAQGAEIKCKPTRDYSDEWSCPMSDAKEDEKGRFYTDVKDTAK